MGQGMMIKAEGKHKIFYNRIFMARTVFILLCIANFMFFCVDKVFAGGIYHNSNQSAEFVRTQNRNASTDVDAVFYNPAGTTKLKDGLYAYFSNQTIIKTYGIKDSTVFPASYNSVQLKKEYKGYLDGYIYPDIYVVYKQDKWAYFGGFSPLGGGGSAIYSDGLPGFHINAAGQINNELITGSPASTATGLMAFESEFEASSVYYSAQLGAAYAINKMLSLSLGGRMVYAVNTAKGSLAGIYSTSGIGNVNFLQKFDFEEKGQCYSIIAGINLSPVKEMNIGIRYEYNTDLELTRKTSRDDIGAFNDRVKTNKNLPMVMTIGVSYLLMPELKIEVDLSNYFNEQTDWDGREDMYNHGWETGMALEYTFMTDTKVSIGYLYTKKGNTSRSFSEFSTSQNLHQFALGTTYPVFSNLDMTIGFAYGIYEEEKIDSPSKNINLYGVQKLEQTYWDIGIGLTYKIM